MNSSPRVRSQFLVWLSRGERRVFAVQVAVIFCLISVLNLGFIHQRELREVAATHRLHTLVHSWDGFAWYAWVLAAPVMLLLIRRYPLSPDALRRNLWRFGLGSAALYIVVT